MAALMGNSVMVVVVRMRPQAIRLAMITTRKLTHGFPFLSHDEYGAPLDSPLGRRSSAINKVFTYMYTVLTSRWLILPSFPKAMSTCIRNFFFCATIFLQIRKFSRPHAAYLNRFQPSTRIRLYPQIFWFALVPSSFAGEYPTMSMHIIAILAPFLSRHSYCDVLTVKACSLSLKKMSKSSEKVKKSMLILINGPMMKLNYCWRSRKNTKRSKLPKALTGNLVLTSMVRFSKLTVLIMPTVHG